MLVPGEEIPDAEAREAFKVHPLRAVIKQHYDVYVVRPSYCTVLRAVWYCRWWSAPILRVLSYALSGTNIPTLSDALSGTDERCAATRRALATSYGAASTRKRKTP